MADLFYRLNFQLPFALPDCFESSEYAKLLWALAQDLGVLGVQFSRQPLFRLGNNPTLLEGDFVNGFIQAVREALSQPCFKEALNIRRKTITQLIRRACKLIDQLAERYPELVGIWFNLEHPGTCTTGKNLAVSHAMLTNFIHQTETDRYLQKALGYFWVRRFRAETGYGTRFLCLFDGAANLPIDILGISHSATALWGRATNSEGVCSSTPATDDALALKHQLEILLGRDTLLRLRPVSGIPHAGISELPRATAVKRGQPSRPIFSRDQL